jgi:serine/threonine protein phosphatase PrpC
MPDKELGAPSCTFLASVITPPSTIDIAGLGDCRAYWLDRQANAETLLTADDSWAAAEVAAHKLSFAEAYADRRAHMITRWLGLDADPTWKPTISHFEVDAGRLVLCSDGLWNYASEPGDVAAAAQGDDESLIATARRLVTFANDKGGHDNITVVLVDLPLDTT